MRWTSQAQQFPFDADGLPLFRAWLEDRAAERQPAGWVDSEFASPLAQWARELLRPTGLVVAVWADCWVAQRGSVADRFDKDRLFVWSCYPLPSWARVFIRWTEEYGLGKQCSARQALAALHKVER